MLSYHQVVENVEHISNTSGSAIKQKFNSAKKEKDTTKRTSSRSTTPTKNTAVDSQVLRHTLPTDHSPKRSPCNHPLHYRERSTSKGEEFALQKKKQDQLKGWVLSSLGKFGYKDNKLMEYINKITVNGLGNGKVTQENLLILEQDISILEDRVIREEGAINDIERRQMEHGSENDIKELVGYKEDVMNLERLIREQQVEIKEIDNEIELVDTKVY